MSVSTITLSGMEFHAYHGCYDLEKKVGNRFVVDLRLGADVDHAASTDDISRTVNYLEIYNTVDKQMNICSDIIENVAWRICETILADFPQVLFVETTVAKIAPPVGGKMHDVSVTITKKRA